jgi:hypothetical protein
MFYLYCSAYNIFPVLPVPFCLSHFTCTFPVPRCPGCPDLAVLFQPSCPDGPALAVLSFPSSSAKLSACPVLPVPFCLSRSACPVLPVWFCLFRYAFPLLLVPLCLACAACPALPVLFCLSNVSSGSTILVVILWLSHSGGRANSGCLYPSLFCPSYHGCPFLAAVVLPCPFPSPLSQPSLKMFAEMNLPDTSILLPPPHAKFIDNPSTHVS